MSLLWTRPTLTVLALALVRLTPGVGGYKEYQDRIPNGARVPHPCKPNFLWHGVGHFSVQGGGARNQFGLDFAAAVGKWTPELCRADSDGDGKSNGEELGDPECTWTPGDVPQSTSGITHPGVCDPFRDDVCSSKAVPHGAGVSYATVGDWMEHACVTAQFECAATRSEDVQQLDFRIPVTPVPAKETTYVCMTFEWPDVTQDFHVIATEPIINNAFVMHHMVLYGCPDDTEVMRTPRPCGMAGNCRELVSTWGLGLLGQCFHDEAGIRAGGTGFKRFLIQYHWNNPKHHDHLTDSSGMTLYYTSRLRPYNQAMLMVGQNFILIPPRSLHTFVTADCSSACTRALMSGDIQVTSAINHMHYLGKAMNIELHRCGRFLMNLTEDHTYNYDSPKFIEYPDEVTVKPGDMIRTNCQYSSRDKTSSTFWGKGTADEMCYGFLTYYPRENLPSSSCTAWKGLRRCDENTFGGCSQDRRAMFHGHSLNQTDLYRNITSACSPFGPCTDECKQALRIARKCEPCLSNPDVWDSIRWGNSRYHHTLDVWRFYLSMATCQTELYEEGLSDPRVADSIACPAQDRTPAPKTEPEYSDQCTTTTTVQPAKSGVSAARETGWGVLVVSVALVSYIFG